MSKKISKQQREFASFYRAGKFCEEAKKQGSKLSREFLRTPYGLEVKKG